MVFSWEQFVSEIFAHPGVDEVLINGCHGIQVVGGDVAWLASPFLEDARLIQALQSLAHTQRLRLDPLQPVAGGILVVSSKAGRSLHVRWHALLPPVARDGPLLSLRRHRLEHLHVHDFLSEQDWRLLQVALQGDAPLFIIGPTAAGKTSLLVALLQACALEERVAILEQVPEIARLSPYWVRLCAQEADLRGQGGISLAQVFDELLRLRPDRLVIGELRREELAALKRSLLAGHRGVWCTLHTASPETLSLRLADLSGDRPDFWAGLCRDQGAVVLVMQRKKPRVREAWVAEAAGWKLIFSSTTGTGMPGSS